MNPIGGDGYRNPYQYRSNNQQAKTGEQTASGAEGNRAPTVPVFPNKNTQKTHATQKGSHSETYHCASKEEAYAMINNLNLKRQAVANKIIKESCPEVSGWSNTDTLCSISQDGSSYGMSMRNADTGDCVSVSNIAFESCDITNVKFTENPDGTWEVSFTYTYTVSYDIAVTTDWQAGDVYTDENGYKWQYQEDGSWVDITNAGGGSTVVIGGKTMNTSVAAEQSDHVTSTRGFLEMFQATQDVVPKGKFR